MSAPQHQHETHQPQPANSATPVEQFLTLVDRIAAAHIKLFASYVQIGSQTPVAAIIDGRRPPPASPLSDRIDVPVELIRARAYQRYEQRGDQPGDALDDWHGAENELRRGSAGTTS